LAAGGASFDTSPVDDWYETRRASSPSPKARLRDSRIDHAGPLAPRTVAVSVPPAGASARPLEGPAVSAGELGKPGKLEKAGKPGKSEKPEKPGGAGVGAPSAELSSCCWLLLVVAVVDPSKPVLDSYV